MSQEKLLYLIPYAGSLGISLGILFYVWTWKNARGAYIFFWYVFGQTLVLAGNILEMLSFSLDYKLFWESFQWLAGILPLLTFPIFVVSYTEFKLKNYKRLFALSLIFPAMFALLVLTEGSHELIYLNPTILQKDFFSALVYENSPIVITYTIYRYFIVFAGCAVLVYQMIQPHNLYRAQIAFILAGTLFPIFGSILSLMGVFITRQSDIIPFVTVIGNLLLAWGVFRFRIFEVLPIARDRVFEALIDPVVILDMQNQVVDVNSAMLNLLGMEAKNIIGHPAKKVFETFPIPIKQYTHISYAQTEAVFEINRTQIHFELTVWPLYDSRKEMTGRVYICHDITALKQLESELRKLNTKLEDRVRDRTHELAEAYESMLEGFARALELRDKETEGHSRRVTEHALKIAKRMGLNAEALEDIRSGSILHDIGKISIPDEILHKQGKLTAEERRIIESHPETAFKLLSPIPFLKKALEIPYSHHEKWDGTGYPQRLKGEEIPLSARIFAVADVWDALSHDRPYNKAWARETIIAYLSEQSGKHFDPIIVKIFLVMVEKGEI